MEKTAKITRTVFKNEWNNPKGGQIFYHDIELDNGDKGQIGSKDKEPEKLNPGKEITYTIDTSDARGNKIKLVQVHNGFKGGMKGGNGSFALAYAKDVVIGSWCDKSPAKLTSKDLFDIADKMYTWLEDKK